jgi:hypothetical protein
LGQQYSDRTLNGWGRFHGPTILPLQRRLDVIVTYSRFHIVGAYPNETQPFHEMMFQARQRR